MNKSESTITVDAMAHITWDGGSADVPVHLATKVQGSGDPTLASASKLVEQALRTGTAPLVARRRATFLAQADLADAANHPAAAEEQFVLAMLVSPDGELPDEAAAYLHRSYGLSREDARAAVLGSAPTPAKLEGRAPELDIDATALALEIAPTDHGSALPAPYATAVIDTSTMSSDDDRAELAAPAYVAAGLRLASLAPARR